MAREIDERKKRRILRKLRRAAARAEAGDGPGLSDWEQCFLEELEDRIDTYGSAFADPAKGDRSAPLSNLQDAKLKEIERKARGKGQGRRIPAGEPSDAVGTDDGSEQTERSARPTLRVINGGRAR